MIAQYSFLSGYHRLWGMGHYALLTVTKAEHPQNGDDNRA